MDNTCPCPQCSGFAAAEEPMRICGACGRIMPCDDGHECECRLAE